MLFVLDGISGFCAGWHLKLWNGGFYQGPPNCKLAVHLKEGYGSKVSHQTAGFSPFFYLPRQAILGSYFDPRPYEARSEFTEKESSLHLDIHIAPGA